MLRSVIKFARVRIIASCYALVFLGAAAGGQITWRTGLAFVLVVAFVVHANSINDYTDRDIDAINLGTATDRPLVSRDVSLAGFWGIHFASAGLMLGLSTVYGWRGVWLTVVILVIDYIYSLRPLRLTDRTFAAPLVLAAAYTYLSFSVGFWSASSRVGYPWLLSIGLALGFVARLLLKDFRDVKGDKRHGKTTFLLRFGPRATCLVSGIFWLVAMVVVGASTSFAYGVCVPLGLGSVIVCWWLQNLSKTRSVARQLVWVAAIAQIANAALVVLLAYLLCDTRPDLSSAEAQLLPLSVGLVLLGALLVRTQGGSHVAANS